jgi:hypothetical protein
MQSHLLILSFSCRATSVLLRNSLPVPIASSVLSVFSYTSFKVSGLILRSLIHFELIFVQGDKHGSNFSFLLADIQFSQHHLLKRQSSLHLMFLAPLSKSGKWIYIWVFCSVPMVFISVFVPVPCCFYCYGSVV